MRTCIRIAASKQRFAYSVYLHRLFVSSLECPSFRMREETRTAEHWPCRQGGQNFLGVPHYPQYFQRQPASHRASGFHVQDARYRETKGAVLILACKYCPKRLVMELCREAQKPSGTLPIRCKWLQVEVAFWDTAGQERFHSLAPLYYRDADAALLVSAHYCVLLACCDAIAYQTLTDAVSLICVQFIWFQRESPFDARSAERLLPCKVFSEDTWIAGV